jgi:hypothetical protein
MIELKSPAEIERMRTTGSSSPRSSPSSANSPTWASTFSTWNTTSEAGSADAGTTCY